jgi:hypothetical protein
MTEPTDPDPREALRTAYGLIAAYARNDAEGFAELLAGQNVQAVLEALCASSYTLAGQAIADAGVTVDTDAYIVELAQRAARGGD